MNGTEAANILGLIESAYPKGPWPEDTETFWLHNLVSYEYDVAQGAVRRLVDTMQFTPSWANFVECVGLERSERRRRAEMARAALPSGPTHDPVWRTAIGRLRAQLDEAKQRPMRITAKRPAWVDEDGVIASGS